ncbi:MAG: hypothetical protein JWR80_10104 [Bradyrhizobium sp.]|nr:hypothetical protein [Bradyrhizobium sp.]
MDSGEPRLYVLRKVERRLRERVEVRKIVRS